MKSSYSQGASNCVDVFVDPEGRVIVHNSRQMSGPSLVFSEAQWRVFMWEVQSGRFAYELLPLASSPWPREAVTV